MKTFITKCIPLFALHAYHAAIAFLAAVRYGFPSRRLKVIGVTGTNGKTTVAHLIAEVLTHAGRRVAISSSVLFAVGDAREPNTLKMTMPGRFAPQRLLRRAVRAGCEYAIIEVTSEGIRQHRHRWIRFKTAVFTNLSPEHIERHGGFDAYRAAKGKLFAALRPRGAAGARQPRTISVINCDDPNAAFFMQFAADIRYGYGFGPAPNESLNEYFRATSVVTSRDSQTSFTVRGQKFSIGLPGKFNASNALAAIAVGVSEGVPLPRIAEGIAKFSGVPGRMECIQREPFRAVVDYAHTPVALESAYRALIAERPRAPRRLICVLGAAGGGRDAWKRPELGGIAAAHCRTVIVTNEDPYDEDPSSIIRAVAAGAREAGRAGVNVYEILDRRAAIQKAIGEAHPGDAVIVTGKGSELWMCMEHGRKIPWDDRRIVREALESKMRPRS